MTSGNGVGVLTRAPDQVAFVVEDLDAAAEAMSRSLGAAPWIGWNYTADYVPERVFRGQPGRFESRVAAWLGAEPNLELIQPVTGPSIFTEFLERHGPGMQHLGYFVDDFAAPKAHLESLGYEEIMAGGKHGLDGDGWWAYFVLPDDPTGLAIEIVEPPKRRREPHFRLLD